MRFDHWLSKNDLNDTQAADLFGCSAMQIGRIRKGQHIPRLSLVQRIEERTDAAVTLADLRAAYEEAARSPSEAA